jgi:16S rRNA (guanine527-N7)-methyltransferase
MSAIIVQGAKKLNIELPPGTEAAFRTYYDFLERRGRDVNLTAICGEENVARLHFLDSLALLGTALFDGKRVLDIGSGAGFPGVPLKLARPSIELTLLDSTKKRITFLSELCAKLDIEATCLHARAEEAALNEDKREQFDIVVSRGVSDLKILCELCLPFIRIGGLMIAMKGVGSEDEIKQAHNALATLGAELQECYDYTIPGTKTLHRAVLIHKTGITPSNYPRRFARIKNSPL